MPFVNIQFHMLRDELVDFAAHISTTYLIDIELRRFFPKTKRRLSHKRNVVGQAERFGDFDEVTFLYNIPRAKEPERLVLYFGGQRGRRLDQSFFNAGTSKPAAFALLRKIAAELKRRTKAGLWMVDWDGESMYVKEFRISKEAASAARAGSIQLVSPAANQTFQVDRPPKKTQ